MERKRERGRWLELGDGGRGGEVRARVWSLG